MPDDNNSLQSDIHRFAIPKPTGDPSVIDGMFAYCPLATMVYCIRRAIVHGGQPRTQENGSSTC